MSAQPAYSIPPDILTIIQKIGETIGWAGLGDRGGQA